MVADRKALVVDDHVSTYADLESRANRLADWLGGEGIGPGDHVGCYLYNGPEYVETMLAAWKLRAVPINVNYRYVSDELRYLCRDAELKAIVHDADFAERLESVRADLPELRISLAAGAGGSYEAALAEGCPERRDIQRSADDLYVVYTGGTTGMPKGVVWRHEDAFYACFGGGDWTRLDPVREPEQVLERVQDEASVTTFFAIAPLMHGAAQWTTYAIFLNGGLNVLTESRPSTDYARVWQLITEHRVNVVTIIGDAVARPLIDEYKANPGRYDASSIFTFGSGAVPFSEAGKAELQALFPQALVTDGYGASETGAQARYLGAGRFATLDGETAVIDPVSLEVIEPGSTRHGRVARRGHIPLRYHNDPLKTAETFVEVGGQRWVLTGDEAVLHEDGTIRLLGRGSMCINSGGEKIFPEEVEAVIIGHPGVYDVLVVGIDDPRWGQSVAAVVAPVAGEALSTEDLDLYCREKLAGYKLPRSWTFVDAVRRSPSGKADYAWAKRAATSAYRGGSDG